MLKAYDNIADYILEMDMLFFSKILKASYEDKNCHVLGEERCYRTGNDTIYECLPQVFSKEQLEQQCKMNNGEEPTESKVSSMLRNWKRQGLIVPHGNGFKKK